MKFGDRLENLLDEYELTQKQLSAELHIAPTTLNGYIKNNREPDYGTLIRLANYFKVSTDYLLGLSNIKKYPESSLSVKEGDLVGTYRCLRPEKQNLLLDQAHLYQKYDLKYKEHIEKKANKKQD